MLDWIWRMWLTDAVVLVSTILMISFLCFSSFTLCLSLRGKPLDGTSSTALSLIVGALSWPAIASLKPLAVQPSIVGEFLLASTRIAVMLAPLSLIMSGPMLAVYLISQPRISASRVWAFFLAYLAMLLVFMHLVTSDDLGIVRGFVGINQ